MSKDLSDRQQRERLFYDEFSRRNPIEEVSFIPVTGVEHRPWNSYWRVYELLSELRNGASQRLLDFGCGPGVPSIRLASLGYDVYGFDICERHVDMCRRLAEKYDLSELTHFSVQKAEELDYEDGFFDVVTGFDILHHVEIAPAIHETFRVLRPGGMAVFREWIEVPVFEAVRNSWLGRRLFPKDASLETHITEDEHKLTRADIKTIKELFPDCRVLRFAVCSRLRRVLPTLDTERASRLERFDNLLMKTLPATRQLGGEAVLVMHKAGSEA